MADRPSSTARTPDEEDGNENAADAAAAASSSSSSSQTTPSATAASSPQPPVAAPPVTASANGNSHSNDNGGENDNTAAKDFTINMEDLRYGAESFAAIVKPVFLTMILTALAVVFISTPESTQANEQALSNTYKVIKPPPSNDTDVDGDDDDDESTTVTVQQLGTSLVNGVVIVSVVCAMTFVIVLLYKYRCMKCLLGYMILSTTLLLSILTAAMFQVAIDRYQILIDMFSFWYLIYNFALVGTGAIFWSHGGLPQWTTQGYLVSISVIVAWQLSHFDAWTAWVLLVLLALYDLFAVLTPCGPLKALVQLMQRDDAPSLPGLLYEAHLPNNNSSTTNRQSSRSRQQQHQQQQPQQVSQVANVGSNDESRNATTNDNGRGEGSRSDDAEAGDRDNNRRPTVARNAPPTRRNTSLTEDTATSERSPSADSNRSTDLTEATVFSDEQQQQQQRSSSLSLFVGTHAPPTRRSTSSTEATATSERSSPENRSTDLTEATVFSDEQQQRSSSLSLFVGGTNGDDGSVEIESTAMMKRHEENSTPATETNNNTTTAAESAVSIVVNEAAEPVQDQPPNGTENRSTRSGSSSRGSKASSSSSLVVRTRDKMTRRELKESSSSFTTSVQNHENSHVTTPSHSNDVNAISAASSGEEEDEEVASLTHGRGDVAGQDAAQVADQESTEPPSSQAEPIVDTNNENTGRIPLAIAKLYQVPARDNPRWMRQPQSSTGGYNDNEDDTQAPPPAPEFSVEELKGLVDVVFPRNGGRIVPHALQRRDVEIRYCVKNRTGETRRILFVNDETGAVFEDPNHERTAREERKQRNSIRLGLGDFIFYSILVAKAALYSWTTFAACTLSIISGLGLTLLILAVRGHALPALPISIFLGVIFYLITRYLVEPFVQQVFIEDTYV